MKKSIAKDSSLNLAVQIAISLIAFLCVPHIVRLMGVERFGLLSILWLFVGYMGLLDLGLGNASVKYLSENFSRNELGEASALIRTVMIFSGALSLLWCMIIFVIGLVGIENVMAISVPLRPEARVAAFLLGLCIPAVLLQGPLRSVLYASRRFDLLNAIQGGSGILQWGGSLIILLLGGGLLHVVGLTLAVRYGALAANAIVCRSVFPEAFQKRNTKSSKSAFELLKFGGWITISQVISPIIVFLERLLIANMASLAWVSFYTVPNDAIMKLVIIPMSLATTLLPSISATWWDVDNRGAVKRVYWKAVKFTFLVMAPCAGVLAAFHQTILMHWMGGEFVSKSSTVFVLFSVGILFHSLAQIPSTTLLAIGRPDIAAKLLVIELPIYCLIAYLLTSNWGVVGTATAWTLRVTLEALVLFGAVHVLMRGIPGKAELAFLWKGTALTLLTLGMSLLAQQWFNIIGILLTVAFMAVVYVGCVWVAIFDHTDREMLKRLIVPQRLQTI